MVGTWRKTCVGVLRRTVTRIHRYARLERSSGSEPSLPSDATATIRLPLDVNFKTASAKRKRTRPGHPASPRGIQTWIGDAALPTRNSN